MASVTFSNNINDTINRIFSHDVKDIRALKEQMNKNYEKALSELRDNTEKTQLLGAYAFFEKAIKLRMNIDKVLNAHDSNISEINKKIEKQYRFFSKVISDSSPIFISLHQLYQKYNMVKEEKSNCNFEQNIIKQQTKLVLDWFKSLSIENSFGKEDYEKLFSHLEIGLQSNGVKYLVDYYSHSEWNRAFGSQGLNNLPKQDILNHSLEEIFKHENIPFALPVLLFNMGAKASSDIKLTEWLNKIVKNKYSDTFVMVLLEKGAKPNRETLRFALTASENIKNRDNPQSPHYLSSTILYILEKGAKVDLEIITLSEKHPSKEVHKQIKQTFAMNF